MLAEIYTNMEIGKRYINYIPFDYWKPNTMITVVDITNYGVEYIYTKSKNKKIYHLSFKKTQYFKEVK